MKSLELLSLSQSFVISILREFPHLLVHATPLLNLFWNILDKSVSPTRDMLTLITKTTLGALVISTCCRHTWESQWYFRKAQWLAWHGCESGTLKMLMTKDWLKLKSSRLFILYFSDPRSQWVYRKSQYYQGGMSCCLMSFLLQVLSDMLQNPQLLSHTHIWPKPKVKLGHTDSFYPQPPSSFYIATARNPNSSVTPMGSRSHRDGLGNSLLPAAINSVSSRYAIGPTEFAFGENEIPISKTDFPRVCGSGYDIQTRWRRIERIGVTNFGFRFRSFVDVRK